ncbi:hypothetical protein FEM48_Zijuj08G0078500 [Ziziphus jujuba var. spinosa]|uniref:RWP-RK domain-containing protein n=1 Tax=Ziziphus jujuba var. spinosa TaxID=714518 RepID=A0A978UXW1_ZIZJJ|nr:hypothetical protein FEM48_Zijuj08G0078500 [Ziziphus jujuba var. spinosa]
MDSSNTHFLQSLLVFSNSANQELIRSLHKYRLDNGKGTEIERLFVFSKNGPYMEMAAVPLLKKSLKFRISEVYEGFVHGLWVCIFAFHAGHRPSTTCFPSILSISRNPKLKSIPSFANELQLIFQSSYIAEKKEPLLISPKSQTNNENHHQSKRSQPVLDQDLNCLPYSVTMSESAEEEQIDQSLPGTLEKKKKRAASDHIARIALSDLAKYFDVPIIEASRSLKIGLTVLKRKCREFGIPRWPHRKIKSIDSLIRDLQEEKCQQQEDTAAAIAVEKRQKMLESEKESIERKPFLEIKSETKRFRQDVFKTRHRARALMSQDLTTSDSENAYELQE